MNRLRNPRVLIPVGIGGVIVAAILAFGVFGIQTLFIDDKVDEAAPVFRSGAGASGLPSDALDDETADGMTDAMEGEDPTDEVDEDDPMGDDGIVTLVEGTFVPRSHPGEGRAFVLSDGSDQRFLRFEDFSTDNGPDLNVYLTTAPPDAPASQFDDDFIDLGDLKGNIGSQNYELPSTVDLNRYSTVVVWCVRFGVAFTAAELAPAA